jgi:hypothetical protein
MIISLYARRNDVALHPVSPASTIGTEVSHETISKIVDEISDEVLSWQRRAAAAAVPGDLPRRDGRELRRLPPAVEPVQSAADHLSQVQGWAAAASRRS